MNVTSLGLLLIFSSPLQRAKFVCVTQMRYVGNVPGMVVSPHMIAHSRSGASLGNVVTNAGLSRSAAWIKKAAVTFEACPGITPLNSPAPLFIIATEL